MSDEPEAAPQQEPTQRTRRKRRPKRRQWLRRRLRKSVKTVRGVVTEPHKVPSQLKKGLLEIWRVRGGGFYGVGYVIAFVVLEVRAFVTNLEGDGDIATMIVQEVLQFVFRFAVQSFLNGFIAFAWPVFVVDYLGAWGLLALGVCWLAFERWARPWVNSKRPELAAEQKPSQEKTK